MSFISIICWGIRGRNKIGKSNPDQLKFIEDIQQQLEMSEEDPDNYKGVCYMLDGPGGNGKTFCLETLYAYCNMPERNFLCLCSAYSGKTFLQLPDVLLRCCSPIITEWVDHPQAISCTPFHNFGLVLILEMHGNMLDSDPCPILGDSVAAALLKKAKVIIMDEICMMSKIDLERIERSLRLLMENKHPFGGKIIVLSGDFRQILPIEE